MKRLRIWNLAVACLLIASLAWPTAASARDVVRPEAIKSKRQVLYNAETYARLASLWQDYYEEYPSEYAYANWMYAARYAGYEEYDQLLRAGLKEYPANPTLLYLNSMLRHGRDDDAQERKYLEEAARIDPDYTDPWFSLVIIYMNARDEERLNLALRHLLESGVITDEVMDFNYNTLMELEENAILITNGDNDTYPAWILTRILQTRPDVAVVNRSLLNTTWYPSYVIGQGLPRFITKSQLEHLRDAAAEKLKARGSTTSPGGLVGDTLINLIVEYAERAERPVYFASTLYVTDGLKHLARHGRQLGLVTLVTSSTAPLADQLRSTFSTWTTRFRTSGLESWRLQHASETDAGRSIVQNYGRAVAVSLPLLKTDAPGHRLKLFNWYIAYIEDLLSEEMTDYVAQMWACYASDIARVDEWCEKQGLRCREP